MDPTAPTPPAPTLDSQHYTPAPPVPPTVAPASTKPEEKPVISDVVVSSGGNAMAGSPKKKWGTGALVGSLMAMVVLVLGAAYFGPKLLQQQTNKNASAGVCGNGAGCYSGGCPSNRPKDGGTSSQCTIPGQHLCYSDSCTGDATVDQPGDPGNNNNNGTDQLRADGTCKNGGHFCPGFICTVGSQSFGADVCYVGDCNSRHSVCANGNTNSDQSVQTGVPSGGSVPVVSAGSVSSSNTKQNCSFCGGVGQGGCDQNLITNGGQSYACSFGCKSGLTYCTNTGSCQNPGTAGCITNAGNGPESSNPAAYAAAVAAAAANSSTGGVPTSWKNVPANCTGRNAAGQTDFSNGLPCGVGADAFCVPAATVQANPTKTCNDYILQYSGSVYAGFCANGRVGNANTAGFGTTCTGTATYNTTTHCFTGSTGTLWMCSGQVQGTGCGPGNGTQVATNTACLPDSPTCDKTYQLDVGTGSTTTGYVSVYYSLAYCRSSTPPVIPPPVLTPVLKNCNESCQTTSDCKAGLSCGTSGHTNVCWANSCQTSGPTPTPTTTTSSSFQCKAVAVISVVRNGTPITNAGLSSIQIGDVVTFRGFGTVVNTTISKIKFTLTKGGVAQTPVSKDATLTTGSTTQYEADYTITIDTATSYSVVSSVVSP